MDELKEILKSFSELRDKYSDIETAVEAVCISTGIDRQNVLDAICGAGLYVPPGSEVELQIKHHISSADMTKTAVKELVKEVAFCFCISTKEAERLVHKGLNSKDI